MEFGETVAADMCRTELKGVGDKTQREVQNSKIPYKTSGEY